MRNANRLIGGATRLFTPALAVAALAAILMTGCKSGDSETKAPSKAATSSATSPTPAAPVPSTPPVAPTPAVTPAPAAPPTPVVVPTPAAQPTVRIKTGVTSAFVDSSGNTWLADQGFTDGETIERAADMPIANTKDPALYRSERYMMTTFSYPLPNGKYTVKLHFAETYDGISGPGERVFSFNVEGQEFKDFDIWVKSGGAQRAYIEAVNVEITDGKLNITFTPKVENPEINGIEIIPAS